MNITIVPTLRLKFTKDFSEEDNTQFIDKAGGYGGQVVCGIANSLNGRIEEEIFVLKSSEKLTEFKNTVTKNISRVKPSLMISYNRENNNSPEKIGQKLKSFAYFFGGEARWMSYNKDTGSIIFVFWSNCMCKAYAKCMKLL